METRYKVIEFYNVDGKKTSRMMAISANLEIIEKKFKDRIKADPFTKIKIIQEDAIMQYNGRKNKGATK